jgi:hypothetical protein
VQESIQQRKNDASNYAPMQQTHRRRLPRPLDPPPPIERLVIERWAASLLGVKVRRLRQLRNAGALSCWRGPNGSAYFDRDELSLVFDRLPPPPGGEASE